MTYFALALLILVSIPLVAGLIRTYAANGGGSGSGATTARFGTFVKNNQALLKTIGTVILLVVLFSIKFPASREAFFTNLEYLSIFLVVLLTLFLNYSPGGASVFMGPAKLTVWGFIAFIIWAVLIAPNTGIDEALDGIEIKNQTSSSQSSRPSEDTSKPAVSLPKGLSKSRREEGSHTMVSPTRYGTDGRVDAAIVLIDGTNEYDSETDRVRLGHNTTVTLAPDECAEVQHTFGWVSYVYQDSLYPDGTYRIKTPTAINGDSHWEIWPTELQFGETAFYPKGDTRNGVVIVLWSGGEHTVTPLKNVARSGVACNPYASPAEVYLLFNTVDKHPGIEGSLYLYNGWNGKKAQFDVRRCPETIEEVSNTPWFSCS